MKKINYLCSLLFLSVSAFSAPSITLCSQNAPVYPYLYYDQNPQGEGLMIEMVRHAAQNLQIDVKFIPLPWLRCQQAVQSGHIDGLIGMIKTPERARAFRFPESPDHYLDLGRYHLFYPLNSDVANQLREISADNLQQVDFLTKGLGAPFGYVIWEQLRQLNLLASSQYDEEKGLKMVSTNRIDGYVVEKKIGQHWAEKLGVDGVIGISSQPLMSETWHMAINKTFYEANSETVEQLWQQFPLVRAEYQAID